MLLLSWCLMSSDVIWHIRDKLWPMPKHGSIRKVYACLAVTCHLHFWQNDRDFLRATAVTRGWNGYRNKSQHRKSTLEKKILPPFQQGFEPATFQSRVRRSNHWAIPAPLLLSMIAFSYVGILSLFWVPLFHALYLNHLPPSSFLEGLSSEQFAELASVHLLAFSARACSLAFLSSGSPFLAIYKAVFVYLVLFFLGGGGGLFLFLYLFSDSVDFSYSEGSFFLFFSGIFHVSSTVLFFVLFFQAGLHCLLRMHTLNSCVGDKWQRLWRDDFTHNGKQVVNRLKIPKRLSTLMFRRWSEVPSRGGVRGDSP